MREKKLLIFMPSVEGGGVEKNFFLVSNYLNRIFSDVNIITSDKKLLKGKIDKKINIIGPSSRNWSKSSRYPKYLISIFYLIKFLFSNRKTLVFSFQANLYAAIITKIFKCKIITRSNSSSVGWSKSKIKKFLYTLFLKLPDKVIVNSYDFKRELDSKFNINALVIYNPLNKSSILRESKKKINLNFFNTKAIKLISVGRLVDQKDHVTLLKAVNIIKNEVEFRLLIIGSGKNKSTLDHFIKKNNLKKIVKIIPFQQNPLKFIKKSDLFLLSSKYEGLPNVLLEAQCLKKFIISTNCPTGPREILINGALGELVNVGNYKKMASKIILFKKQIKHKSIKKKIKLGYKNLSRFDYNFNMQKYENIIKKFMYF